MSIIEGVLIAWIILYLIPDLIFHHLQWHAFQGSRDIPAVALTFDDGPGPDTALVLDALKKSGAHATFFIVAERGRNYPEILQRMVAEGHQIGVHGYHHRSMYLFWPWQVFQELQTAVQTIEDLTGVRPTVYRAPWGHTNAVTLWALKRLKLTRVFWSIAPDDWRPDRTADFIAHYVVQLSQ
ncbi:MAG: polysaccharide deacetylase family protein, partial [Firmicutes bacterium]|nr:polysaccharide deacetylase family protein [Bacillota bacterium]